jgi:hypothetical protein
MSYFYILIPSSLMLLESISIYKGQWSIENHGKVIQVNTKERIGEKTEKERQYEHRYNMGTFQTSTHTKPIWH